jgi:hypothetical protein
VPRIETLRLGIDQPIDFRRAFRRAVDAKMDAMLVHSSPIFVDEAAVIAEFGREFRLPSIGLFPIYTKVGGFISHDRIILNCSSRLVASSAKLFVVRNRRVSHTETGLPLVPNQYAHRQIA